MFHLATHLFEIAFSRKEWRRARDSNPRYPYGHNGFQDRRFQPLTQLSAGGTIEIVKPAGLFS